MDSDSDRAELGTLAAGARMELLRRVERRTDAILSETFNKYRTGELRGEVAIAAIATIGEMRLLLAGVETTIRQGEQARERLMAPSR